MVNKVNHQLCRKSPGAVGYLCSIAKLFYTQLSVVNSSPLARFQISYRPAVQFREHLSHKSFYVEHLSSLTSKSTSLFWLLNTIWNHRLDVEHRLQELLHNLICSLLASILDPLDLLLGILICVFFGLLVSACVLILQHQHEYPQYNGCIKDRISVWRVPRQRTSDSNFLNSSSFAFLYASISFFASSLASFTRFVRSIPVSYPSSFSSRRSLLTFSGCKKALALEIN